MKRKMKRIRKTIICAILVLSMVVCNSSFVEAKKISKQESVYVNAGADGSVSNITVSDWLKGSDSASGTIRDLSELQDITNVKGDEIFSQKGNDVDWTGAGKDIYYQGKSSKELPVELVITYKLDGKEMKANEMLGKSGKWEMQVSYKNKSSQKKRIGGKETTIYTPFVMVTGMILPSEHFEHIEIDNGRVVNDGDNNIVVGMGVPGMAESLGLDDTDEIPSGFTVTADAKDFSMSNTFTYGSANFLNELDLDDVEKLDDLEEKLDDLTEAADQLVDGSEELSDNMKMFSDKMGDLKESVKKFQKDGVGKLAGGIRTLAKGTPALVKGVSDYTGGVKSFAEGTTNYVKGAEKITNGCTQLYNSVAGLPAQIKAFDTGLKTYTGGVDQLGTQENVTKLKTGAKAVSEGVTTLHTKLGELEQTYTTTGALVQKLEASGADAVTVATLKEVLKQQKAGIQALKAATGEEGDLKKGADSVSAGVTTVMDSLSQLAGNSSSLTGVTEKLNTSMPTLVSSVKTLKEGGETLAKNNGKLKKASKDLVKAGKTLKKSVKKVGKGVKTLDKGGKSLKKATKKLSGGVLQLGTASGKLYDGSRTLAEGMSEFIDEGITKLNDIYEEDIKGLIDRLKAIREVGQDYRSFSGIHDSMDGEVRFIIETDAVEKED